MKNLQSNINEQVLEELFKLCEDSMNIAQEAASNITSAIIVNHIVFIFSKIGHNRNASYLASYLISRISIASLLTSISGILICVNSLEKANAVINLLKKLKNKDLIQVEKSFNLMYNIGRLDSCTVVIRLAIQSRMYYTKKVERFFKENNSNINQLI